MNWDYILKINIKRASASVCRNRRKLKVAVLAGALCTLLAFNFSSSQAQSKSYSTLSKAEVETLLTPQVKLSEVDVHNLERLAGSDGWGDRVHKKLLIYFGEKSQNDPEARSKFFEQVYSQIRLHPDFKDSEIDYHAVIYRSMNEEAFEAGKKLWLEQAKIKDTVSQVQANAAWYFQANGENELAEKFLIATAKLEPKSQLRAENLGLFYNSLSRQKTGAECANYLKKSLLWLEKGQSMGINSYNLSAMAFIAFEAKSFVKAQKFAQQTLDSGFEQTDPVSLHYGNILLGRLALRSKDMSQAKKHLLESVKFPKGFKFQGEPNMSLAKELLEKGERNAPLQYFQLCSRFWISGKNQLKEWTGLVKQGKIPDFGQSLYY